MVNALLALANQDELQFKETKKYKSNKCGPALMQTEVVLELE
jgi:hypothetical protein